MYIAVNEWPEVSLIPITCLLTCFLELQGHMFAAYVKLALHAVWLAHLLPWHLLEVGPIAGRW